MNTITQQKKAARFVLLCCMVALLVLGAVRTRAQLVNGDFESNCVNPGGGYLLVDEAFQAGTACITGSWFVSHGTPDIIFEPIGNSTAVASMWGGDEDEGEGLFIECPDFEEGVQYRLRFRYYVDVVVGTSNLDHIYVSLTNDLVHNANIYDFSLPVVAEEVVMDVQDPPEFTWTTVDIVFTPTADYQQLWFYPRISVNSSWVGLYIDDVELVVLECPNNVVYNNFAGIPAFTEATTSIEASGNSGMSGIQQVDYQAGYSISLGNEFHADPTGIGYFHAYIAPCSNDDDIQSCEGNGVSPKRGDALSPVPMLLTTSVDNYPNPFTGKTTISYTLAEPGSVALVLTNMLGEEVISLVRSGNHSAGKYSMEFDGSSLVPGVYFLTLQSGAISTTRKMVITR